jgi:hypothetical protein
MVGPGTLRIPLLGRVLQATGDKLLRAEVNLLVRAGEGWQAFTFRVDSAAEMTCMPAAVARLHHINHPTQPMAGVQRKTVAGVDNPEIRAGAPKVQVQGLEGREFYCPCLFVGDPNQAQGDYLMALTGVIKFLRLTFDGAPSEEAPFGSLIIQETEALPRTSS